MYEASSYVLKAVLHEMGILNVHVSHVPDSLSDTVATLSAHLNRHDVVLLTGGVSVGDYDFVVEAADKCGVQLLFHKVKQRPGKPLFFGRKDQIPVFGLPGNPSSVLTCFYEYVWPLLNGLLGKMNGLRVLYATLKNNFHKENQLTQFLKGFYQDGEVMILGAQESFRLQSYALANCLVVLPEESREYIVGETVEIHLIPCYG